jgi:hypothetical protein
MTEINSFDGPHRFLSNFWPAPWVKLDGIKYHGVEWAYQAAKTLVLKDREPFNDGTVPAGQAKHLGQSLVMRPDWHLVKVDIMTDLVEQKFNNSTLLNLLYKTGSAILIEGNRWHDQFWGDCYCVNHKDIPGRNQLGKILMKIRDRYTTESEPSYGRYTNQE